MRDRDAAAGTRSSWLRTGHRPHDSESRTHVRFHSATARADVPLRGEVEARATARPTAHAPRPPSRHPPQPRSRVQSSLRHTAIRTICAASRLQSIIYTDTRHQSPLSIRTSYIYVYLCVYRRRDPNHDTCTCTCYMYLSRKPTPMRRRGTHTHHVHTVTDNSHITIIDTVPAWAGGRHRSGTCIDAHSRLTHGAQLMIHEGPLALACHGSQSTCSESPESLAQPAQRSPAQALPPRSPARCPGSGVASP